MVDPLRINRQWQMPDLLNTQRPKEKIAAFIKQKDVIAVIKHRLMIHTNQRAVTRPGHVRDAILLAGIRNNAKIINRKYKIVVFFMQQS